MRHKHAYKLKGNRQMTVSVKERDKKKKTEETRDTEKKG